MEKLTYSRRGDYYIPNLKLSEQPDKPIGKYGRMWQMSAWTFSCRSL